jgi:hypothetical protein
MREVACQRCSWIAGIGSTTGSARRRTSLRCRSCCQSSRYHHLEVCQYICLERVLRRWLTLSPRLHSSHVCRGRACNSGACEEKAKGCSVHGWEGVVVCSVHKRLSDEASVSVALKKRMDLDRRVVKNDGLMSWKTNDWLLGAWERSLVARAGLWLYMLNAHPTLDLCTHVAACRGLVAHHCRLPAQ